MLRALIHSVVLSFMMFCIHFQFLRSHKYYFSHVDRRNLRCYEQNESKFDEQDVIIYIIDSGIRESHQMMPKRIENGVGLFPKFVNHSGEDLLQPLGHGTFVASQFQEPQPQHEQNHTHSLQPKFTIVPVQVISNQGSGTDEAVFTATQFAVYHRNRYHKNSRAMLVICLNEHLGLSSSVEVKENFHLSVLQTSYYLQYWWAGVPDYYLNALQLAHENRFVSIVSSGNDNIDACTFRKRERLPNSTIMVGATVEDKSDTRAPYSNYGPCITLFAGGSRVGASANSDQGMRLVVGTSASTPAVANKFAAFWSASNCSETIQETIDNFLQSGLVKENLVARMRCDHAIQPGACAATTHRGLVSDS